MLMCEDVTEQRRAAELIEYHASYDTLTNLPNRRLFMDQLQQALARAKRHGHQCAILFLDLDNFKTINDSLGHPVGDTLLCEVARRIQYSCREEDTVARLGGDEFVVLLAELSDQREEAVSDLQVLAENLRLELGLPYNVYEHELHITPSIGIAVFPSADETADDVLRQADTAMYQAKESGRNAVRFFLPSMQRAAELRLLMISELRKALPRSELLLHFQPQFDKRRQLCGAEALLRWQHPERGLITPDKFIPAAEEAGLILPIGDWVMREALQQLKAWHGTAPLMMLDRVAVNVSALQFHQHDFVNRVERALGDTGADPSWLTLEMTESILLEDFEDAVEKMQSLKRLGVRFSIDDFGTGYSSLAYLKRLPVDEIKIDRSFVSDVMHDPNDAALVDTILTLARHIGLEVVAEGVENEQVFGFLCERGCPSFQGYHFGRPCEAADFGERFLDSGQRSLARQGH
jgi:diguanylate cyclase (GGDEF)-like protein